MKKLTLITTSLVSALLLANAVHAADATSGSRTEAGTLEVTGKVVGGTCDLDVGADRKIIVQLDDAQRSNLSVGGTTTQAKEFEIKFKNCTVGDLIKVEFTKGSQNIDALTGALKNTAPLALAAKNVQIQIANRDNSSLNLSDAQIPVHTSTTGVNVFQFKARYLSTGLAGLGDVQSSVPFTVTYN